MGARSHLLRAFEIYSSNFLSTFIYSSKRFLRIPNSISSRNTSYKFSLIFQNQGIPCNPLFVPLTGSSFRPLRENSVLVNRKDGGPKRDFIRGAFPPYDLSVARKRQHLYTRNSCRYTAIGHSRAGLRHTYTRTTRAQRQASRQQADRGLAREPLSMLVHVQPVRRFTVRRILRRRPLRRGQTSLWIL